MTAHEVSHNSSIPIKELLEAERVKLLAAKLRDTLKNSAVLTPDSEGYAKSIKRWSDAAEMPAVSYADSVKLDRLATGLQTVIANAG